MKRLAESTPHSGTTADIPQTYAAMLPHVRQMADVLVDRLVKIDNDGSKQVKLFKSTSGTVYEHEAWNIMFIAIDAQKGNPGAYPWATSLYWRRYDTFSARWNDLVVFVRASKGAVANLLICPHANRFASDPASELDRKRINIKGNLEKVAKRTAIEAALAQLETAMANNPGANSNTEDNATIQPAILDQALPQPVAQESNVAEHYAPIESDDDNDDYEDDGDNDSEIRVSDKVFVGVVKELDEEEEAADEESADVVDADEDPNDEDSDDIHGLGGRIESREFIAETESGHALPMHPMAAPVAAGHSSWVEGGHSNGAGGVDRMEILPSAPEHPSGGLQASDASARPLPAGYQHRMNNNSIFNQAITDQFSEDHDSLMAESSTTHDVDEENVAFSENMQV